LLITTGKNHEKREKKLFGSHFIVNPHPKIGISLWQIHQTINPNEHLSKQLFCFYPISKSLVHLSKIDCQLLEHAYQTSKVKLTGMDIKYIICFSANIDVKDISLLFNIEPASVHTVRYRIRRKFAKGDGVLMMV